jgi:translation initiation factor IF-2
MTDIKETESGKKTLSISKSPNRLELRRVVDGGTVKQSFSHGRSKQVTVEVKKKRTFTRGTGDKMQEIVEQAGGEPSPFAPTGPGAADLHGLSEAERTARLRALEGAAHRQHDAPGEARAMEARAPEAEPAPSAPEAPATPAEPEAPAEAPAVAPAEASLRAKEPARREGGRTERVETRARRVPTVDPEAEARERAQSSERSRQDELARQLAAQQVPGLKIVRAAETETRPGRTLHLPTARPAPAFGDEEEGDGAPARRARGAETKRQPAKKSAEPRRRAGKLTINQALDQGEGVERQRSLAAVKRAREREKQKARLEAQPEERRKVSREVVLPEAITVQDLANRMAEKGADVVKVLFKMGVMATINQVLDPDTAELVASEMGHRVKRVTEADVVSGLEGDADDPATLAPRPPIVTVMGHVDHGKTSLLDALRKTDVAAHEAGGITQHIGAYQVQRPNGQRITFIDTPGHAAFTQMRARGAKVTDIVVLVVAADDGVQPQTVEAIAHAKAAGVPMIVAVNKIDKHDANPQRVKQDLLQHEIVVEELGGETQVIEVSALKGTNLDKLEEAILLQAEVLELKANPVRAAQGTVIEAKLDRGRGPLATALVQRGTLRVGDIVVAGTEWGKVRALMNERGESPGEAGPAVPVEILGLSGVPLAGDPFVVVEDEARAREITEYRQRQLRQKQTVAQRGTIEQMMSKLQEGAAKELAVVVKADVQGSVEAIAAVLGQLSGEKVTVRVLHTGVGAINESDITLAKASRALVIGFNVRASGSARDMAQRDGIEIRYYSIIYDIADDVKKLMEGLLAPVKRETFIGYAQILQVFKITKTGNVAGCRVTEGVVKRGAGVRLLRDNVVIHTGKLSTLKRFKDEVREVRAGTECGMAFENYQDIKEGDVIECFEVEEVAATL